MTASTIAPVPVGVRPPAPGAHNEAHEWPPFIVADAGIRVSRAVASRPPVPSRRPRVALPLALLLAVEALSFAALAVAATQ